MEGEERDKRGKVQKSNTSKNCFKIQKYNAEKICKYKSTKWRTSRLAHSGEFKSTLILLILERLILWGKKSKRKILGEGGQYEELDLNKEHFGRLDVDKLLFGDIMSEQEVSSKSGSGCLCFAAQRAHGGSCVALHVTRQSWLVLVPKTTKMAWKFLVVSGIRWMVSCEKITYE